MIDLEQTIIAQYANSPILMALINNMNAYIDPSTNLTNFYNMVWNVSTAQGYGLDVLGRIVGVQRTINMPLQSAAYLGFKEGASWQPFGQAPFWTGGNGTVFKLNDTTFRTLILMKALANISRCSAQVINKILTTLFGSGGKCYALDRGNMAMLLLFEFNLDIGSLCIITQSGAIPRPAGVQAYLINGFSPPSGFGFQGSGLQPFGQGIFFSGGYYTVPLPH